MHAIQPAILLALLGILAFQCHDNPPPGNKTLPKGSDKPAFNLTSKIDLDTLLRQFDPEEVHIRYDVEVGREKNYSGVNTRKIFSFLVREFQIDSTGYDVTFFCKDGYSPSVSLLQLLEGNGYIVTKDLQAKDGWDEEIKSKFSPAYLVWDIPENDHRHAFPYGVVQIQFVEKSMEYALAKPNTTAKEPLEGFAIFRDKCIKCHTINGDGGVMGPELNFPKSITEYWQPGQIKLFIKNPASFRLNSKMPPVTGLSDAQIDRVVRYLQYMAGQKTAKHE